MAQIAKMEVQTEIKCSADEFYDIFRSKTYLMPKICPDYIKNIRVLQGDWGTMGSVRHWTYISGSNYESVQETVEAVDENSKSITFRMLEGEILKYYPTYKSTMQVTPMGQGLSLAKWTVEYERKNKDIPEPKQYKDFLATILKSVDAYLLKA